jgi:hypothetical protein
MTIDEAEKVLSGCYRWEFVNGFIYWGEAKGKVCGDEVEVIMNDGTTFTGEDARRLYPVGKEVPVAPGGCGTRGKTLTPGAKRRWAMKRFV